MDAAMVEKIGPVSHFAPAGGWNRARPRGIGRHGSSCSDDHQPSIMGDRLSADFWIGNGCRHDADHGGHRSPLRLFVAEFRATESGPRDGFRICERRVWIISLLPDWFRRGIVYRPSGLDSTVARRTLLVAQ